MCTTASWERITTIPSTAIMKIHGTNKTYALAKNLIASRSMLPGSLTLPFKPHNTQILYLSLLLAYFFVKFEKIIRASLH